MDRAAFRRDPWLRGSACHLATWSVAAFVLDRALTSPGEEPRLPLVALVLAGSLLASNTHERRMGKMFGVALEPRFAGALRMWALLAAAMAAGTLALASAGHGDLGFALWSGLGGAGFAWWGRRAQFGWYVGVGVTLASIALVDLALGAAGLPTVAWRALAMLVLVPAAALWTNRRYLWWRAPAA